MLQADWQNFIESDLFPTLFSGLDTILPEFQLRMKSGNWVAQSNWRPDHREGKSKEKVYIYANRPSLLICYTSSPHKSIISYLMERDGRSFWETLQHLTQEAHLELPSFDASISEQFQRIHAKTSALASLELLFNDNLQAENSKAHLSYLQQRGFTQEGIQEAGIGIYQGKDQALQTLKANTLPDSILTEILEMLPENKMFSLAIPIKDRFGKTNAFLFRNISTDETTQKYRFSKGYKKGEELFTTGKSDTYVLVEGQLDALLLWTQHIGHALAIGGNKISDAQLQELVSLKAQRLIVCFDADNGGKEGTRHFISSWLGLEEAPNTQLFVASLPHGNDPGQMIQDGKNSQLKEALQIAVPLYEYLFGLAIELTNEQAEEGSTWSPADVEWFNQKVASFSAQLPDPYQKARLLDIYSKEAGNTLGVSAESLQAAEARLREEKELQKEAESLQKALRDAQKLISAHGVGSIPQVHSLLENTLAKGIQKKIKTQLLPYGQSEFLTEVSQLEEDLKTGIASLDAIFSIPTSAITLIAGRPGHGKTTLMLSLFLNQVLLYPKKSFAFFTYEEPRSNIVMKLLLRLINKEEDHETAYPFLAHYLRTGKTNEPAIERAKELLFLLMSSGRLQVFETPFEVKRLAEACKILAAKSHIGAIYIDYIQKIPLEGNRSGYEVVKQVSSVLLHEVAVGLGVPIVMGAQLNRTGEADSVRKLSPSMLREAGDLEQDANTVLMLHNATMSWLDQEENQSNLRLDAVQTIQVQTKKRRNGQSGGYVELELHGVGKYVCQKQHSVENYQKGGRSSF